MKLHERGNRKKVDRRKMETQAINGGFERLRSQKARKGGAKQKRNYWI